MCKNRQYEMEEELKETETKEEEILEAETQLEEKIENFVEAPQEPKVITLTVGINGIPELNIQCETDITVRDMATALATIDVLNFNQYFKANPEDALRQYVMFNTLRKQMFLNGVANLTNDEKLVTALAEF